MPLCLGNGPNDDWPKCQYCAKADPADYAECARLANLKSQQLMNIGKEITETTVRGQLYRRMMSNTADLFREYAIRLEVLVRNDVIAKMPAQKVRELELWTDARAAELMMFLIYNQGKELMEKKTPGAKQ